MLLLLVAAPAAAEGVLVDKSEIRFISKQLGIKIEGRFRTFRANVVFLPTQIAKSKAEIEVELASIDLASDDSEKEVKDRLWFDTARFPVARFVSTSFKDLGSDKYEVAGQLSLKGATRPITVPLTVRKDPAGHSVAEGSFTLKRLDFKIGEGLWGDTDTVDNEVAVRLRMVMPPAK